MARLLAWKSPGARGAKNEYVLQQIVLGQSNVAARRLINRKANEWSLVGHELGLTAVNE